MLKEKYKRSEDLVWTAINLPYNTRTGNIDINNLISGYTYDIQVSLNDNRNSHLGDRWKGCGQVTPPNYPEPQVTAYSISKSGDTSTAKSSGETLVVKTEDTVNASWNITDTVGVKEDSCRLVTTNTSGGVNADIFGNTTDRGFSVNNLAGNRLPISLIDQTYSIELNCKGKSAKTVRNINQTINLKVESYPTVSCSIENNKRSVQEGDSNITINATIGNVNSYTWKIGRGNDDSNPITSNGATSELSLRQDLSYVGLDFGRYNPWVEITRVEDNRTTGKKSCGTITNFGSSTIREVNRYVLYLTHLNFTNSHKVVLVTILPCVF